MVKTYVSLRLMSSSKSPEQMFLELEVPADHSWRKGERRKKASVVARENGYEFRLDQPGEMSLEEQTDLLLARVDPISDRIRTLGCDVVQLACVLYASQMPAICFSSSVIAKLARLSASIDVDLYVEEGNWAE